MINHKVKNITASVKARLLNIARNTQKPFQEILQYYGIERFLYRLSESNHRDVFILKGALLLKVWNI
jgi:CTP:phosphocholine cytidylyltransferase-like protein